ncbi:MULTISPECIES: AEC family transporter [Enterobacteriaceae]|jgi:predicted permease|uniref:Transporter n=4 Tax=Enterobacteriaceae TaxID=543 RepID=A0AAC8QP96_9ENTR|nr:MULTISPECIES: AEC family transporter [Enterobacteriaceae]AUU90664.1 AEC family transporter [Enterobacteriaceae bacterium ENNIH3]AUV09292.1 AEC family transporter [Enterobacteriaceae bacterium ENNIH2]MDU4150169.1 AEC family transporter [Enterobacteriaceae bacterium]PTA89869.1 AEC family transporter [Kluyvera sp. Nf5]PWF50916.1 AEC family transporter [[Kluyvera] intestini]QIH63932.1 AEC family transporter [Enterobacteriaceae bacterium A-F18]RDT55699.1 AEC family transporter [Escherichia col
MQSILLQSLFPLVFIMVLGWLSGKLGYTKREDANVMASVVIRFALPFHLFIGALNTDPEKIQNLSFMAVLVIGLMGSYLFTLLVSRFVFRHDIKTSAIQSLVCAFPDMAYFGAPVLAVLIGPEGFLGVLIGNVVTSVFMIPLTIVLIRMGDKNHTEDLNPVKMVLQNLWKAARNPIVWIPVTGILLSLAGVKLPHLLSSPIEMVGKIAGGLSLFALGLLFYGERPSFNIQTCTNIGIKNLIQPIMMAVAGLAFGLNHTLMQQVVIIGATPSAIAAGMFALRSDTYVESASSSILLGTALGVITEGFMIYLVS